MQQNHCTDTQITTKAYAEIKNMLNQLYTFRYKSLKLNILLLYLIIVRENSPT